MRKADEGGKKINWWGLALVILAVLALAGLYYWLKSTGRLGVFGSNEDLQAYLQATVAGFGAWAPLAFFLLQTAQIIISPIPGNVTALVGGALFDFWPAMLISTAATLAGSALAFGLARLFGRPLVVRLVGKATVEKYIDAFTGRSLFLLAAMFLIPFFPDDALCLIAGLTAIRWLPFLVIVLVARPPGLVFSTLVGSGAIEMPVWGWVLIGAAALALMVLSFKYGDRANEWIMSKLGRRTPRP